MLRDFVAANRAAGRLRIAAAFAAIVAATAMWGCGIKGPLRLPAPPPPASGTAPAPTTTPAAPAGSLPVPTAEPEQPPPPKP
jgi:predicted small lipoprotein YifL